ncbi:MerR family transcriptional regulator [Propionimicrobium sp. PCR01-08-3]|uniref:transcriptional regulator FtsR n=1 Tax=Propionimicrobium sp. PCR01-08-3 TaxID=3052086 RepID=UPI00255C39C9|nr:MerR family transcriptional regulator [Propionimicrobium sp. PCR01-08-3]WIY84075.1 MerR family transcriptional regulator [Propionimicrobium sp. PCR01-08-3]
MPPSAKRSIGQVLPLLKNEFPDISISKIRFLESEGLVSPERAPSGYRRYADEDIERLRYILRMQRDHYLPLKVIRQNLDLMDRGIEPPTVETPASTADQPSTAQPAAGRTQANASGPQTPKRPMKLTRRELLQVSGLSEATLIELERQQMVMPRRGSIYYGREALTVCVVARRLQEYGMDTRHMRAIKQAAEREAGLVEQAVRPYLATSSKPAQTLHDVSQLVVHAHAALIYTLLEG